MAKVKKVLLLGSGALQIGQAGEFDYSGSQAIKALKEEGIEVILINPNIATIQTSEKFADRVYFLPVDVHFVTKIIEAEKPNGILLSFGGQTALNCGLELEKQNILAKHNVKVLGTPVDAIRKTEDRELFAKFLTSLGVKTPKSIAVTSLTAAKSAAKKISYPVMIRAGFSLGGQDSGVAKDEKELEEITNRALSKAPQILIEEYLAGWKEIEYEVVRDAKDNCITVCNMENFDPMGIHTGESIVVAPSQTLNNFEYHTLREIAIKVIRNLEIVGECNIQYALNPNPQAAGGSHGRASDSTQHVTSGIGNKNESVQKLAGSEKRLTEPANFDYRIIEVNARLSRSSALASKATGYPLAYVAAKLGLGYSLTEIKNSVTKKTIACFEPALDYLVVKFPRWDLSKFVKSHETIGSSMQSVGEVMAIGRKFEEAIQKACRMLDVGATGAINDKEHVNWEKPTPGRLFSITQALKEGTSITKIAKGTGINLFFLEKLQNIADFENKLKRGKIKLDRQNLLYAKQIGFSDKRLAILTGKTEKQLRTSRYALNIHPVVKQIDTLAAEYPAETNYLYLTYNGDKNDVTNGSKKPKIMVLGSGPYRIGSSVEFDWCSVTCAQTARKNGKSTIIVNCNPETVSTDYDLADKLYFEELTSETVQEIIRLENPEGVIVSMGGQTPNNLVMSLKDIGAKILGTSPDSIDSAEDRNKFSSLCDELSIDQPSWAALADIKSALSFATKIGFPVLVRPSYVLSGVAFNIAFDEEDLRNYLKLASLVSDKYPVVISKFIQNSKEIEIDAVANDGKIIASAISEHVENAGVHSGDATLVLPAQKVYQQTQNRIEEIAASIAKKLAITGPFNIQFLAKDNKVMVIECNLRASRSFPFVSKVMGTNLIKLATEAMLGLPIQYPKSKIPNYVAVKAPQFSFARIRGADPVLRVEMSSTGEVACFGQDVNEAFLKSQLATGVKLPKKSVFISLAGETNKVKFLEAAKNLHRAGLKIYATIGTTTYLTQNNVPTTMLHKIYEKKKPNVLDCLLNKEIDLVINIIDPYFKKEFDDDYLIRRAATDYGIPLLTNLQQAELFADAFEQKELKDLKVEPWDTYVKQNQ